MRSHPSASRFLPFFSTIVLLGSLTLPILSRAGENFEGSEAIRRVGSAKQLFIDNLLISSAQNVVLTMNPPVKTYERNIIPDYPWEDMGLSSHNTVLEDEGIYKMWYGSHLFEDKSEGQPEVLDGEAQHTYVYEHLRQYVCYATSQDGIHWKKPKLGVHAFDGSKENNIVLTNTTGTVFLDPKKSGGEKSGGEKSGGERFKYSGRIGGGFALWIWASPDGLRWNRYLGRPILRRGPFDSQNQVFWDNRIGKYVAYVRRGGDRINGADLGSMGHPVNGEVGTWLAPSGSQICSPFACPYSRLQ